MPSYIQKENSLLPDGIYPFEVVGASEKVSNNNNAKIELTLEVGPDKVRVFDNLTFTASSSWRIDAFRLSTGDIIKGNIEVSIEAEDCIGRKGMCSIVTETYNGRTRNKVDAYILPVPPKGGATPVGAAAVPAPDPAKPKFSEPNPVTNVNEEGEPDQIPF